MKLAFPFNIYLAAFAGAFLSTLVALPLWRRWCLSTNHVDDPGHRKIHNEPIALAGGLAVLTGLIVPLALGAVALLANGFLTASGKPELAHGFERRKLELAAILIGAIAMVVLGWFDDKHELRPAAKFSGQLAIALLVAASGVRITLFVHSNVFSYAVTVLWMLTLINAFNFTDNMNGLCAGLGAIAAAFFSVYAAIEGQYLVASMAFLICGALIGFLPYNFPRATAFLGDAGSHLVGYTMAVLAILPHFYTPENPKRFAVLAPLLILAVPLIDLAQVVIHRTRMGKPFYIGDTNHLSHRLVQNGLSKTTAVLLLWLAATLFGAISFLL